MIDYIMPCLVSLFDEEFFKIVLFFFFFFFYIMELSRDLDMQLLEMKDNNCIM